MGRAWLYSSLLHAALAVLLYVGLPAFSRPPTAVDQPITVELVTEMELSETEPPAPAPVATAPEPARRAASPAPTPPAAEPEPERPEPPKPRVATPPEPAPAPLPEPEPEPEVATPEPQPVVEPEPEPEPQVARLEPQPPRPEPEPVPARPSEPTPKPVLPSAQPRLKPKPPKPPEPEPQARLEPEPPEPPKAPEPEPEAEKAREAPAEPPAEDSFAALLKSVEQLDRREQSDVAQSGTGERQSSQGEAQSRLGNGRLTFSEIDALRRQIGRCWTLPVGADRIEDMVVELRIQVRPDRTVQQVTIQDRGRMDGDPTFRAVAESARRAVDRCSPLQLPPGKYTLWRDIVMSFHPADAING